MWGINGGVELMKSLTNPADCGESERGAGVCMLNGFTIKTVENSDKRICTTDLDVNQ